MTEQEQDLEREPREPPPGRLAYRRKIKRQSVLAIMGDIATFLGIPGSVQEKAIELLDGAMGQHLLQWRQAGPIAGACLYAACKVEGLPRSMSEFKEHFDATGEKRFYECFKIIAGAFNLHARRPDPVSLVSRRARESGLPGEISRHARSMLANLIARVNIQGKDPNGYVAASLYRACKELNHKITQEDMATACSVNVTTLRKRLKEFETTGGQ